MKRWLPLILIICSLSTSSAASFAQTWEAEFDYGSGQEETIDQTDELNLNYSFTKKYFKLGYKLSPIWDYSLTINQGDRNYVQGAGLDNANIKITNSFQNVTEDEEKKMLTDYNFYWANKTFRDDLASSYNKTYGGVRNYYQDKRDHLIGWAAGGANYAYPGSSKEAENLIDGKVFFEKYYYDDNLIIDGYSRIMSSTRAIFGSQTINKIGLTSNFTLPHFSSLSSAFRFGARNSRVDDESIETDLDYDYHFSEISISTDHPLTENLNASASWGTSAKKYIESSYDNSGFNYGLGFEYKPVKNLSIKPGYSYVEKNYSIVKSLTHCTNAYSVKITYRVRSDWGAVLKISKSYYEFPYDDVQEKDWAETKTSVELSKYFFERLQVTVQGEYTFKDYETAWDLQLSTWKAGAGWKW